jgi:hypothetical protein
VHISYALNPHRPAAAAALAIAIAAAAAPAERAPSPADEPLVAFCQDLGAAAAAPSLAWQNTHESGTSAADWLFSAYGTGTLNAVDGFGDLFTYSTDSAETLATGELYSRSTAQHALALAIWSLENDPALLDADRIADGSITAGRGVIELAVLLRDSALIATGVNPSPPRSGTVTYSGNGSTTGMTHTPTGEIIAIPLPHAAGLSLAGLSAGTLRRRR